MAPFVTVACNSYPDLSYGRRGVIVVIAQISICFWGAISILLADDAAPANIDATQSLATCNVQMVATNTQPTMRTSSLVFSTMSTMTEDSLQDYLPQREGEEKFENSDPSVRLLVLLGDQSFIFEQSVFIDGKPFREVHASWLTGLISGSRDLEGTSEQSTATKVQITEAKTKSEADGEADGEPDAEADSEADEEADDKEDDKQPTVTTQRRSTPTLRDKLTRFIKAMGPEADIQELEWLMDQSPEGPPLTVLSPGRSWQRVNHAPLLAVLDFDGNGELSPDEFTRATDRLKTADKNENGVIEEEELNRYQKRQRSGGLDALRGPLLIVMDAANQWRAAPGLPLSESEMNQLADRQADAHLRINFQTSTNKTKDGEASSVDLGQLHVTRLAESSLESPQLTTSDAVVTIDYGSTYFEFTALAKQSSASGADTPEQIAVGAVVDGHPLMRLVDLNNDRRITAREQRRLRDLLTQLDVNGDGGLDKSEIPVAIRLAVGRGPVLHELLGKPTVAIRQQRHEKVVRAPEWFLPMDLNGDGELSRDEFSGTNEQFRQLDQNSDNVVSATEANAI